LQPRDLIYLAPTSGRPAGTVAAWGRSLVASSSEQRAEQQQTANRTDTWPQESSGEDVKRWAKMGENVKKSIAKDRFNRAKRSLKGIL